MATVSQSLALFNPSGSLANYTNPSPSQLNQLAIKLPDFHNNMQFNDHREFNYYITNNYEYITNNFITNEYSVAPQQLPETTSAANNAAVMNQNASSSSASSSAQNGGGNNKSDEPSKWATIYKLSQTVIKKTASAGQKFLQESVDAVNRRIQAEQRLASIMSNNNRVTQEGVNMVRDYALELEKSTAISANAGISGMSQLAMHVSDPSNVKALGGSLYDLTAKMHGTKATSEQMMSVADILGKAMKGQTDTLKENGFAITEQQQKLLKYGTEAERTAAIVEIVEGKIGGLAEASGNTLEGNIQKLSNAWEDVKMKVGQGVLPHLQQMVSLLNEAFQSGKFEPYINILVSGFHALGSVVSDAFAFIMDHLDIVMNSLIVLAAIVAVVGAIWLVNWLIAAWPVLVIIGIVVLLMTILNKLGVTTGQVVGFIAGVFNTLFTFLRNIFAMLWNIVLSVAEFFANIFVDPVYAIKKLFYDLSRNVMDFLGGMINFAIDGLNKLISFINGITGAEISLIPEYSNEWMDQFEPTSNKDVIDFSDYKMEQRDLTEAFNAGFDFGHNMLESLDLDFSSSLMVFDNTGNGDWNVPDHSTTGQLGDVGKVGEVGKIRDTVDISSEDIKMMRELAEMKNIQNFVSLTPSVNVQTGDITNGHDIDTIVKRITTTLETQIASGAKGVWQT